MAVTFLPIAYTVESSFFTELSERKLHDYRLDETPKQITGFLQVHHNGVGSAASPPTLHLSKESFSTSLAPTASSSLLPTAALPGRLIVFNTIESFKACNKQQLLNECLLQGPCPFQNFLLIAYVDLKSYKYLYWFGFPAAVQAVPVAASGTTPTGAAAATGARLQVKDLLTPQVETVLAMSSLPEGAVLLHNVLQDFVQRTGKEGAAQGLSSNITVWQALSEAGQVKGEVRGERMTPLPLRDMPEPLHKALQSAVRGLPSSAAAGGGVGGAAGAAGHSEGAPLLLSIFDGCVSEMGASAALTVGWTARNVISALGLWLQQRAGMGSSDSSSTTVAPSSPSSLSVALLCCRPSSRMLAAVKASAATVDASAGDSTSGSSTAHSWTELCQAEDRSLLVQLRFDAQMPHTGTSDHSSLLSIFSPKATEESASSSLPAGLLTVGWDTNLQGQLGPRAVNYSQTSSPAALAEAAAKLNLSLMRWRMMPELQLDRIASTSCLLFGAGTLGCHIARDLLAWGVRRMTLVDAGYVSFSNPVRQPLFEFADTHAAAAGAGGGGGAGGGIGKPKAAAAAAALKRIHPSVQAEAVQLEIPMPGHAVAPAAEKATAETVQQMEQLVQQHDVIFLLTDTRESRWLPSVLAAAAGKQVLCVGLGFDSYLVMRHGYTGGKQGGAGGAAAAGAASAAAAAPASAVVSSQAAVSSKLGCYFCNDVVAPSNSTMNRAMDQQCTVTRPGLAPIASALAVELLVALLHHPAGYHAPAEETGRAESVSLTSKTASPLGVVPHQMRGFLSHMQTLLLKGEAFPQCTACSDVVVKEYKSRGEKEWEMRVGG